MPGRKGTQRKTLDVDEVNTMLIKEVKLKHDELYEAYWNGTQEEVLDRVNEILGMVHATKRVAELSVRR